MNAVSETEPKGYPGGTFGYVVDSEHRTRHALQILSLVVPAVVVIVLCLASVALALLISPWAAATLVGASTIGTGAIIVRRWWRRRTPECVKACQRADLPDPYPQPVGTAGGDGIEHRNLRQCGP